MNNLYLIMKAMEANSKKSGSEMNITLSASSRQEAERWIREAADALHRTFQEIKIYETKTAYFEIVKHDDDPISFSVHFELQPEIYRPASVEEYWDHVQLKMQHDMEEAAKKLGEEFAYKTIHGHYSEEKKDKKIQASIRNLSGTEAKELFSKFSSLIANYPGASVMAFCEDMEEGKNNEECSENDNQADSDSCDESPCEDSEPVEQAEEGNILLNSMIEENRAEKEALYKKQEELKWILTEPRLVDLQLIAKRKRRHKTDDVLELIKLAYRVGKGDLSVDLKEFFPKTHESEVKK